MWAFAPTTRPPIGAAPLPDPIHGEVHITYDVTAGLHPEGQRVLKSRPRRMMGRSISPATSVSAQLRQSPTKISTELRKAARKLEPLDTAILPGLPLCRFKGHGAAIALPMNLSGGVAASSGLRASRMSSSAQRVCHCGEQGAYRSAAQLP